MYVIIIILGVLEMIGGLLVLPEVQSAIHQILAVAALGFGGVTLALGIVISKLDQLRVTAGTDGGRKVDVSKWSAKDRDAYLAQQASQRRDHGA